MSGDGGVVRLADRKRELTRRALIDAALELFAQRGYDGTSVADIAERAGASEATFFRHFGSKDEVVFSERGVRLPVVREAILERPASEPPVVAAREALRAIGARLSVDRDRLLLQHRALQSTPLLRGRSQDVQVEWEQAIASALAERAGIDGDDPTIRVTAVVAMAIVRTAFSMWHDEDGQRSLADVIDELFEQLGDAVRADRSRRRR